MKGKSKTIFYLLGKVTMAELACISAKVHSKLMVSSSDKRYEVAGMLGRCDNFYKKGFINPDVPLTDISDVKESTPYAEEILILYRSGVAVGDVNMNFSPMQKVSRAEMAAMITRLLHDEFKIGLPKG